MTAPGGEGVERLRAQGLLPPRARDAHAAVRGAFAIQAQDTRASRLGVRARSEGLTAADVVRACCDERSLVRTWAMRGTLHMLCADDVRWVTALTGPVALRRGARRRAGLGLDDALCERILATLPGVLAQGPLTRAAMVDALRARGLAIDPAGQAPAHVAALAAAAGVVCRGPEREDGEPTYVLLDDWVAPEPARDRDAALAELARRYRRAHGPADARDLAHWSGLPAADARRAWSLAGPPPPPRTRDDEPLPVRLLPAFDGVLLGHRDRTPLVRPADLPRLVRAAWILPAVVAGGRVAGTWRAERRRGGLEVAVTPFGRLPRGAAGDLRREAADVGRFLGLPARLVIARA